MIRKGIIVMLTVLAVALGLASLAHPYQAPIHQLRGGNERESNHDWRWGRAGMYLALSRDLWPHEVETSIYIDLRPVFAISTDRYTFFLVVSIWIPLTLSVALGTYPTIAFIRGPARDWRQRCRRRKGLCINCAYDLTGNESGVCPECGTEIKNEIENP